MRRTQGNAGNLDGPTPHNASSRTGHMDNGFDTGRRRASRNGATVLAIILFLVGFAAVLAVSFFGFGGVGIAALIAVVVADWLVASSVHIVLEWEKAVVLRFGKFNRVAGPGIVFTWPTKA